MAKTALFTNWTGEEFNWGWNGNNRRFAPGQSLYMPDYLAQHYAKHLTNRELLSRDSDGNLKHKNGDKFTSPKRPGDVPLFMELFNKAYTPDKEEKPEDVGDKKDDLDSIIDSENKNREAQAVIPPEKDDESFGEKPEEGSDK